MSRSRKKSPWIVDKKDKKMKRLANKRVRRTRYVANGSSYKKVFESWDISDYKWLYDKDISRGPEYRY